MSDGFASRFNQDIMHLLRDKDSYQLSGVGSLCFNVPPQTFKLQSVDNPMKNGSCDVTASEIRHILRTLGSRKHDL